MRTPFRFTGWLAALCVGLWLAAPCHAYIEAPHSFGAVVAQSTNIYLMRVEAVDKEKKIIIFRKVQDIKGKHPQDVIKHNFNNAGLRPDEWKKPLEWAEPGKLAVMFHNGGASETCLGKWWYQAYAGGEWWNHVHGEPFLLRSYTGAPEKLVSLVGQILDNKEVIVPCMIDAPNKDELHQARAKVQRLKVSLKLQDYNPKRDFVGWGGEDFRRLQGMPGYTHISALGRVDPDAQAISVVDFDGDGKLDLCLVGGGKVLILQNGGDSLSEVLLPGVAGARSAVWADYNGDGKPDLLLATPTGPRLFTNLGGSLRDDSHLLPQQQPYYTLTAAAWLDYDGDGHPDLLLANGYHGLRLFRNLGQPAAPKGPAFEDVTAKAGLADLPSVQVKADFLTVCDVNGDGRPDFLLGVPSRDKTGRALLLLNRRSDTGESRFTLHDSGITYTPGKVSPIVGDFDNDGSPDLFVPQKDGSKLYRNKGNGAFEDVTAKAGDLAKIPGWATCAAWGDVDNDGHLDLVVGTLLGCNRLYRNRGNGTFEDATETVGLAQKIFNTQALSLVDLNNDGTLDLICNNEGQEAVVLLGSTPAGKCVPLTLNLNGLAGALGSRVEVTDKAGKIVGVRQISGGDGRGGQEAPVARFTLAPGAYKLNVRLSNGQTRSRDITLGSDPLRTRLDEAAPAAKTAQAKQ